MPERKHRFTFGEYYHIYNRGNSKQTIFLDVNDHVRFQRMLFLANGSVSVRVNDVRDNKVAFYSFDRGDALVAIGAYCLMPNHFHILLTPLVDGGVSLFMQKLTTGYSMYFNTRRERTGSLFEGKFKSKHVNDDVYLKYLFSYIHMNPLKLIDPHWKKQDFKKQNEIKNHLEQFPFSSLMDYLDYDRKEKVILSKDAFPHYFSSPESVRKNIYTWFAARKDLADVKVSRCRV